MKNVRTQTKKSNTKERESPKTSARSFPISRAMSLLEKAVLQWKVPIVTRVAEERSPYKVLISCLISLRTKDDVTDAASTRLFQIADTPEHLAQIPVPTISRAIYPAGFYKTKAQTIRDISVRLVREFGGRVPDDLDTLLTFKGVGRKTANLVVTLGFGKPGICVDTHVHRITNRWGYVKTRNPEQTEFALREILPPRYWLRINDLLVTFGQNQCHPVSPRCSTCPLRPHCPQLGVTHSR